MDGEWLETLEKEAGDVDYSRLEEIVQQGDPLDINGKGVWETILSLFQGDQLLDPQAIWSALSTLLLQEIREAAAMGAAVLAVCIVINLLENLSDSFVSKGASSIGTMACSSIVILLCLRNFADIYNVCRASSENMLSFMQAIFPVMIPLLAASGAVTAGTVLDPVLTAALTIFMTLLNNMILPALFVSCILLMLNTLTERSYLKKMAVLIRTAALFLMGLAVTCFGGLSAVQGFVSGTADGLLLRSARYSVDNFVPVIGGFASDSIDMVMACAGLIKNGVGIFGLLAIAGFLLIPLLKLLAVSLIYKLLAAFLEPMGSKGISDGLNELGTNAVFLAIVLLLAGILFLLFLAVLIKMGTG